MSSAERLYEIGDFVKYDGIGGRDIGQILSFETPFHEERMYLNLLNQNKHVQAGYEDARPIFTEAKHLLALGFEVVEGINGRKYYSPMAVVSEMAHLSPKRQFLSGFCVADFPSLNNKINFEKYIVDGEICTQKFHEDFPSVHNINHLFRFIEQQGFEIDKIYALSK